MRLQRLTLIAAALSAAPYVFAQASLLSRTSTPKLAVLHGRVKDQQCAVLAGMRVRVRSTDRPAAPERTARTDDGGNYTVQLAAGAYDVCVERGTGKACTHIDMPASGDKWMTTQLREAAPDLSSLGNHAE